MIFIARKQISIINSVLTFQTFHYSKKFDVPSLFPKVYSVYLSQSNDIFTNLALEDWLFKNVSFDKERILLIWRNEPSVVIGRHQNPWVESNTRYLQDQSIKLARRNSGGGTVYHDMGNINLTFFMHRKDYNRKENLTIILKALERMKVLLEFNERDDLLLNGKKVSGTAAKLSSSKSYHHCSLLVQLDKQSMQNALKCPDEDRYHSKATKSVKSPVTCISSSKGFDINDIIEAVGNEYLKSCENGSHYTGFSLVNPTDYWFQGINKLRDQFMSWDWIYGRTPPFSVYTTVEINDCLVNVKANILKGKLESVEYDQKDCHLLDHLIGMPYSPELLKIA